MRTIIVLSLLQLATSSDIIMFITSTHFAPLDADFGPGCQASAANFPGRTLSPLLCYTGMTNVVDSLPDGVRIVNTLGVELAANKSLLVAETTTNVTDENGNTADSTIPVWTGCDVTGAPSPNNCINWTSTASFTSGEVGFPFPSPTVFFGVVSVLCTGSLPIYCVAVPISTSGPTRFPTTSPTSDAPTTSKPTTSAPSTTMPTTSAPSTSTPTTSEPSTATVRVSSAHLVGCGYLPAFLWFLAAYL